MFTLAFLLGYFLGAFATIIFGVLFFFSVR
jgi:hypothetical protein